MELTLEAIISLLGLFMGGGGGAFFTWRWMRRRAKADAKSAEVEMAQKVQDTYQQMLEDKQKEVDDNHRLISELREDRDHYKQSYVEFRDQFDKLSNEFRQFRNETEEERAKMKRDIARNDRRLECMTPLLCGRDGCAIRVPVIVSPNGEIEQTIRPQEQDQEKPHDIDPNNED